MELSAAYRALTAAYPQEIRECMDRLFASVPAVLGEDNVHGILLVGSAARNELSVVRGEAGLDIHSDIEYIVVTHRPVPVERREQIQELHAAILADMGIRSPLFAIDCSIATRRRWKLRPRTLFSFEARELGVVVMGADVRADIPVIGPRTLDLGSLNTLILVRLWNMLLHTPRTVLLGNPRPYEAFITRFYYARNVLDLLTIYLPARGILKAGYRERARAFAALPTVPFTDAEVRVIAAAHRLKLDGVDVLGEGEVEEVFFTAYLRLLALVSSVPEWDRSPDTLDAFMDAVAARDPFRERGMTRAGRLVRELRMYVDLVRRVPGPQSLLWIARDKRYPVLKALIALHAIVSGGYDHAGQQRLLERARAALANATGEPVELVERDIMENVDRLRTILMRFMMRWRNASTRLVAENELLALMNYREPDRPGVGAPAENGHT